MTKRLSMSFSPGRGVERATAAWRKAGSYRAQAEGQAGPAWDWEAAVWAGTDRAEKTHLPEAG